MLSCASFLNLKNRDLDRQNQRLMLKIPCAACPCLSQLVSAQFALKVCLTARNRQKIYKNPLFWRSRLFKIIEFGVNREPVYDFLLVINSNLGFISHHYWDTATYWPKIANFCPPLSFSALVRGDPFRIYGKALRFLKLEFSRQPTVKIWWYLVILACNVLDWSIRVTDRQSDRQTELRWLRRAESSSCFRA